MVVRPLPRGEVRRVRGRHTGSATEAESGVPRGEPVEGPRASAANAWALGASRRTVHRPDPADGAGPTRLADPARHDGLLPHRTGPGSRQLVRPEVGSPPDQSRPEVCGSGRLAEVRAPQGAA